jgi:hypothetical protein
VIRASKFGFVGVKEYLLAFRWGTGWLVTCRPEVAAILILSIAPVEEDVYLGHWDLHPHTPGRNGDQGLDPVNGADFFRVRVLNGGLMWYLLV